MKQWLIAVVALVCMSGGYLIHAQPIVISHEEMNASGWFGGDNRDSTRLRSVGIAQSVVFDTTMMVETFSFYFDKRFDYFYNPDHKGHPVTLRFHIRDANGNVLESFSKMVPDTFNGGWVTFEELNYIVRKGTELIFSCYLEGALDTALYTNGYKGDNTASFTAGTHYVKIIYDTTDTFEDWTGWSVHSWDAVFRLEGSSDPSAIAEDNLPVIEELQLYPNYPNPFNPGTTVHFWLHRKTSVQVEIFDARGQRVTTLFQGSLPPGQHRFRWNGTNTQGQAVATGVYLVRVVAEGTIRTQKIQLIR